MFPSYHEIGEILDELAEELPPAFFHRLNLGVVLFEDVRFHKEAVGEDLVVLGEYRVSKLGRQIRIYYGSFERIYRHATPETLKEALRETLRHEFTHHVQYLAGNYDLEKEDKEKLDAWKRRRNSG